MKKGKRPKLPRGLRWKSDSQYIWFSWRNARGQQRQKSTGTDDPVKALAFKLDFLEGESEEIDQSKIKPTDLGKLPLPRVAELYFNWKTASNSAATVERERRIFANVRKFFGSQFPARAISLSMIQQYQQERRKHVSKTMKQFVSSRTVNYELQLLRAVMSFAHCWTPELDMDYKPLRHVKSRVGKVASKSDLMMLFEKAKANDYWQIAMYSAAVAIGTGCRAGEIRKLQLRDIHLDEGKLVIRREIAKNRHQREPRLMGLAEWGLRHLVRRAHALGAVVPEHYLLPLHLAQSKHFDKTKDPKWDLNRPMTSWVRSWRRLVAACGMPGFRFHDLRHTFRTLGAEAGVPLEVMMAQLGHLDRETSLEYVHIQQRALERATQLIEHEQAEILAAAEGVTLKSGKGISSSKSKQVLDLRQPAPGRQTDQNSLRPADHPRPGISIRLSLPHRNGVFDGNGNLKYNSTDPRLKQ